MWTNGTDLAGASSIYLTTFVIPFMLLCYLYSCIGIQLKHREMPGNADASRDLTMQTKRAKVSVQRRLRRRPTLKAANRN